MGHCEAIPASAGNSGLQVQFLLPYPSDSDPYLLLFSPGSFWSIHLCWFRFQDSTHRVEIWGYASPLQAGSIRTQSRSHLSSLGDNTCTCQEPSLLFLPAPEQCENHEGVKTPNPTE